ncbi:hypothetical protein MPS39_000378 [Salmonella enterica]|nr:hypothetical protein [Salmonella enterica]
METVEIMLDQTWQRLTDGTVNATLQITGAAGFHLSAARPGDDARYYASLTVKWG